jgi:selenocysteine-specific elongation factor
MPIDELRRLLDVPAAVFAWLLDEWERGGDLARDQSVVRSADRGGAVLSAEQRVVVNEALADLRAGGSSPPEIGRVGLPLELAKALERAGELVFVAPEIAYPADVWSGLQKRIVELIDRNGRVTVSEVRSALGTSRKYALPLLQKLDATGITRRSGDVRELGPRGRELAR